MGMPVSTPGGLLDPVFDLGTGAIVGTAEFNGVSGTTGLATFTPSAAGANFGNAGVTLSVFDGGASKWYIDIERQSAGSKVSCVDTQKDAAGAERVMQILEFDGGPVGEGAARTVQTVQAARAACPQGRGPRAAAEAADLRRRT